MSIENHSCTRVGRMMIMAATKIHYADNIFYFKFAPILCLYNIPMLPVYIWTYYWTLSKKIIWNYFSFFNIGLKIYLLIKKGAKQFRLSSAAIRNGTKNIFKNSSAVPLQGWSIYHTFKQVALSFATFNETRQYFSFRIFPSFQLITNDVFLPRMQAYT